MIKEKHVQFIASFLIVLVLTIPFYTTSTYAAINTITVKGSGGIEGFAKSKDSLDFKVHVSIGNETIKNDQVFLGSGIKFDKCSPSISSGSECDLRYPSNGTTSFESRPVPFTVNLYKDDGTLDSSKSSTVVIDNKAPQFKLSLDQDKFSEQDEINLNFEATDFACNDPSCSNKCVGIKNVELYTLDGQFEQTVAASNDSSGCKFASSVKIPNSFALGQNSVFGKALDKFGQASAETSVTFKVVESIRIISESFAIKAKGVEIHTYSSKSKPVAVSVNVSGATLNPSTVEADLSALNPSLKTVKASCTSEKEDLHLCKWSIDLKPNANSSKTVKINAREKSGTNVTETIAIDLTLDDKGPVVKSLSTSTTVNGTPYGRSTGNEVIATFDEETGLLPDESFLYVGNSKLKASSCTRESSWQCSWKNLAFSSATKISIKTDTKDIFGNAVTKETSADVIIDNNVPEITSIDMTPIGGTIEAFPYIFKIGDKISVVANVSEDNDVFAVADFSDFITEASNVVGSCEVIGGKEHVCTWLTDSIDQEADSFATFNFSDSAGNQVIVTRSLKTLGLDERKAPDFWKNEVSCSPKTIDRQLGPLINQKVFCEVKLQPKSSSKATTAFIGEATCADSSSLIEKVETFNNEPGSTSPFISIELKKDEFRIDSANITCSLSIFSRVADTVTKNPEIESASVNLQFSNLPLGELSDEINRKIKEAKEDAEGIWDIIGVLNKIVFYAKKICQIINTFYTIVAALYLAYFTLKGAEFTCTSTGILNTFGICDTIYAISVGQCGTTEGASQAADKSKNILNKFCDYVTCKETFLWGPTVRNWINNADVRVGGYFTGPGNYVGPKTEVSGSGFFGQEVTKLGANGFSRPISEYMDPNRNLIVATLFVCLPGIIYGLDKMRQIQCLYADCLQNAVAKEGLPVKACQDQKAYATCKYVTTELFAVFPWTAVLDHFLGLIKNALSNPFAAIGVVISLACPYACYAKADLGIGYKACRGARLLTLVGDAASNVKNIIDEGFTIRADYCERLKNNENK